MNRIPVVLVSACLLGVPTRYDGGESESAQALRLRCACTVIPVCPEQLGGLPTPRPPAEIAASDGHDVLAGREAVINSAGVDVTEQYVRGAQCVAQIAAILGARRAVLKEGSPACGVCCITRKGRRVQGRGVAAALLHRKGVELEGIE